MWDQVPYKWCVHVKEISGSIDGRRLSVQSQSWMRSCGSLFMQNGMSP